MPELARRTEPDREDPEHRIRVEVDEGTVVRRARPSRPSGAAPSAKAPPGPAG